MILRYTMCNKKEYQWSSSQHNEIDIDRFACNSLGATRTKHDTLIRKKELAHEIIIMQPWTHRCCSSLESVMATSSTIQHTSMRTNVVECQDVLLTRLNGFDVWRVARRCWSLTRLNMERSIKLSPLNHFHTWITSPRRRRSTKESKFNFFSFSSYSSPSNPTTIFTALCWTFSRTEIYDSSK